MPLATKKCRVCGKEYEACHTNKSSTASFRWQDVACSPECGAIYLAQIRASREEANNIALKNEAAKEEPIYTKANGEDVVNDDQREFIVEKHRHKNRKH